LKELLFFTAVFLFLSLANGFVGHASTSRKPARIRIENRRSQEAADRGCVSLPNDIDVSGLTTFVQIARFLQHDREPPERLWKQMEESPGYSILLKSEFTKVGFREPFRLALMPSRRPDRDRALGNKSIRYLDHYSEWVPKALPRFPSLLSGLLKKIDPCAIAKVAGAYLPSGVDLRPPRISVVIFSPDARGYDPIVLDLSVMETCPGQSLQLLLAHEFHHNFRKRIQGHPREPSNLVDEQLLWALDQLQAEGIADLINVPDCLRRPTDFPASLQKAIADYSRHLAAASESLRSFDILIRRIRSNELKDPSDIEMEVRKALPFSGHPTGFHMARLIKEKFGIERLREHVADPFSFIHEYQLAAKQAKGSRYGSDVHLFSPEALKWIDGLRARMVAP